jgi:uncharacterized membrane protein
MSKWYEKTFNVLTILIYALYVALLVFGWNRAPGYLETINNVTQIFVGLMLIYFFNPFMSYRYDPFHRKLAFTAGFFLISATILTQIMVVVQRILKPVRKEIREQVEKI